MAPRGRRTLTPGVTTTYTLSVTGAGNTADKRTVTVVVAGTMPGASAADASATGTKKAVPRTADGKPDFSGVYGYGAGGGGRGAPPPVAAGGLPTTPTLKPGREKYKVARAADDTGQYSTCLPPGIPQTFFVPYYIQIVQAPKHLVVAHEYLNLFRIIPTDGRPHPADPIRVDGQRRRALGRRHAGGGLDRVQRQDRDQRLSAHRVAARRRAVLATGFRHAAVRSDHRGSERVRGPVGHQADVPVAPGVRSINEFVCENNRDYKPLFGNNEAGVSRDAEDVFRVLDPGSRTCRSRSSREGFIHTTEGREAVSITLTRYYKASAEPVGRALHRSGSRDVADSL